MNLYLKQIIALVPLALFIGIKSNAQYHDSYSVAVQEFQKDKDCVNVDYTISVDPSKVGNCEFILVEFFIEKEGHKKELTFVILNGKAKTKSYKRAAALGGLDERLKSDGHILSAKDSKSNIPYNESLPYDEWMNGATLYAKQSILKCDERPTEEKFKLATLLVPEEVKKEVKEEKPEHSVTKETVVLPTQPQVKSGVAYFDFVTGRSALDFSLGKNRAEWNKIIQQIRQIKADENAHIISIEFTGYASPDGPYYVNEKLSYERTKAVANQLLRMSELLLAQKQITTSFVAEDWDGLVALLKDSNIAYKEEVLSIIDRIGIFDGREKVLMDLANGDVYRTLLKEYFPKLRRTEYKITYEVK